MKSLWTSGLIFSAKILECEWPGQRRRLIKLGFDNVFVGEIWNVTKAVETVGYGTYLMLS